VTLKKRCTPEQWNACPKICKVFQDERKKIRSGEKKNPYTGKTTTADLEERKRLEEKRKKTKLDKRFDYGKQKGKCVRRETPGGLQETSVPAMFQRIEDSEWAKKYEPKVLSRDPPIMYMDNFLTDQQVDDLLAGINESGIGFQPSFELQAGHSQRRKSESLFCSTPKCFRDPRIMAAHHAATNVTGLHLLNHEYIQILKYREGDFYVTHQDTSNEYGWSAAGHRVYTLFVYLSTVPPGFGGETNFPALKLSVPPKKGGAVLWANVQKNNPRREEPRCNHAALAVKPGDFTKFGMNMWLYGYDWRSQFSKGCMNKDAGY
jgi:hypothetical protein